jgi:hypothetical protein
MSGHGSQHLDGSISLTHGPHRLGRYTAQGKVMTATISPAPLAVEKTCPGKVPKMTFPPRLEIPQSTRNSHFPPSYDGGWLNLKTGHFNLLRTMTQSALVAGSSLVYNKSDFPTSSSQMGRDCERHVIRTWSESSCCGFSVEIKPTGDREESVNV